MEIISMDIRVFNDLCERMKLIEAKVEEIYRCREDMGLKQWLDNQDVCLLLDISKRTLQSYREKGLLPYSQIRHKIFYKPKDVRKLLESSHYLAIKKL